MIKVKDIDQVEGWTGGGEMLQPGTHNVRVERATETLSSGGYDQVELEYTSIEGAGSIRDWLTFATDENGQIKRGSLARARALLDAVMIEPESGEWEFPTQRLVGRKLQIVVVEEPKYDDPSETQLSVFSVDVFNASPESGPDTRDLPGANGQTTGSDDEIPF